MYSKSLNVASAIAAGLVASSILSLRALADEVYPLADPGFESGVFAPNISSPGWLSGIGTFGFSQNFAHTGTRSMRFSGNAISVVSQQIDVVPWSDYTLSGWGYTPNPAALTSFAQSTLFLTFSGPGLSLEFINSSPFISSSSPANTWVFMSETLTAPTNATSATVAVGLYTSMFSPGAEVYLDDITLTVVVPEPSVLALLGMGSLLCLGSWNRRQGR